MGFDRVAPFFAPLERLAFQGAMQRARTEHLAQVREVRRALLLGEGDGRLLTRLLEIAPAAACDVVEASAAMIARARRRLERERPRDLPRVRFHHGDVRATTLPEATFDLVVTPFFLDCFGASDVDAVVARGARAATANARWLHVDFHRPDRGLARRHAELWLAAMYAFFRVGAALEARSLAPAQPALERAGFRLSARSARRFGMIRSELWTRTTSRR